MGLSMGGSLYGRVSLWESILTSECIIFDFRKPISSLKYQYKDKK